MCIVFRYVIINEIKYVFMCDKGGWNVVWRNVDLFCIEMFII